MKKAIQVIGFEGVQALNELFEDGYEIESINNNGIYILDKTKKLEAHAIKSNLETNIALDTAGYQRALKSVRDKLKVGQPITYGEAMNKLNDTKVKRYQNLLDNVSTIISNQCQPHIRIEFDDIRDVPKVWIDGKPIDDKLARINLDWNGGGDVSDTNARSYSIEQWGTDNKGLFNNGIGQRAL